MAATTTISSNHFSVDQQALDAFDWINARYPESGEHILSEFPELQFLQWELSHFDTEAMGVDIEWGSWLIEAIEATGLVWWEEGEPWAFVQDSE